MKRVPDFDDVWKEYYPKVYIYLKTAFGFRSGEDLEDLVQEIFLKAYRWRSRFNPGYSFSTWLYRIARNHCIDRLRTRECRVVNLDPENLVFDTDPVADGLLSAEVRRAVQVAVLDLPEDERTMVFLRYYEELACRDIAGVLDLPEGTVKSRFYKIRQKLEKRLEEFVSV